MTGYLKNQELTRIDVDGSGQSVYFPKDNDEYIGVNKAESSKMNIYMVKSEVSKIVFLTKPVAVLHPIDELPPSDLILSNFRWYNKLRPINKFDIFRK